MTKTEFIFEILRLIEEYDLFGDIWWDENINFLADCNDIFYWGTADAEPIRERDLELFRQSLKDLEEIESYFAFVYGPILYCCRKREMRPQNAFYNTIPQEIHQLFDACGDEREADFGNPQERKE